MKKTIIYTFICLIYGFIFVKCNGKTERVDTRSIVQLSGDELKVVAEIYLKPDAHRSMKPIFEKVIAGSQAEEGCIYYDLHHDIMDTTNTKYMILEVWKDQEAIDLHNDTPHFKNFSRVAKDYVDSMKITTVEVSK